MAIPRRVLIFSFVWLYLSFTNAQLICDDGLFTLIDANGTAPLPLYVGTSNYQDNFSCLWVIKPSGATSITLIFSRLDMEYNWDYVNVYIGADTSGVLYASLTGYQPPDVMNIQASAVTIQFLSDESIDFTGFQVNYYTGYVPTSCNNGYAIANTCICNAGWSGTYCDQPFCTNNCNAVLNQGTCVNNVCNCTAGYFGGDCSKISATYCSSTPVYLSGSSGSFQDHHANNDFNAQSYLPFTNCTWVINSTAGYPFTLVMDHHQVQYLYDTVTVYDANNNILVVWSSDGFPIDPVIVPTSSGRVTFKSDATVQFSGFEAAWYSHSLCANDCSGAGWCVENECRCYPGYAGSFCELAAGATVLLPNVVWQTTILDWETQLFQVDVTYAIEAFILDFARHPLHNPPYARWGGGFPQFGIARNAVPSRNASVINNNYWFSYYEEAAVEFEFPPIGTYYIAVYGLEESGYAISIRDFIPIPSTSTSSTLSANETNQAGLTAAIVIIVLIVVALAALAGGVWWYRRRKGRNFNTMRDEDEKGRADEKPPTKLEDQQ